MTEILGWWFAAGDTLPHGDGRKVVLGETLTVSPPIKLCKRGLHWCRDPFDALQYAPGEMLYRVRAGGEILEAGNKGCSTERTALACRDTTQMLRLFARRQALSVIHLWDAPLVVREYLEEGDESKRDAASDAAQTAQHRAARAARAAWNAWNAWDAAWAAWAARTAARAAWDAKATWVAWDAWAAARGAWAAAGDAARTQFGEMVAELFEEA